MDCLDYRLITRLPRGGGSSSNHRPAKSYTVLQTVRHRYKHICKQLCFLGAMLRRWAPC